MPKPLPHQAGATEAGVFHTDDTWQAHTRRACTDVRELVNHLQLPDSDAARADADNPFPLRAPLPFLQRMGRQWNDPLLRQILPTTLERENHPDYAVDPVQERRFLVRPGLIHKYRHRVLLIATGACPVHCRYCFRRHFPYAEQHLKPAHWHSILDYLRQDPAISEVIYSGGDPLSLSDDKLAAWTSDLEKIPHIRRLRIHSRFPIVLPQRINANFLRWLQPVRLQKIMIVHCNHANEIDQSVVNAVARLKQVGCTVLNQAVLLQGVNDRADAVCELSERLFEAGILPYYLNVLDRVQGSAHFAVAPDKIVEIYHAVRARLPGYLVPKLVYDDGGHEAKSPWHPPQEHG